MHTRYFQKRADEHHQSLAVSESLSERKNMLLTWSRLLRDPKPSVVNIAWVVDCVEQRRHVEETPYVIDLKEINVAGTNKVPTISKLHQSYC